MHYCCSWHLHFGVEGDVGVSSHREGVCLRNLEKVHRFSVTYASGLEFDHFASNGLLVTPCEHCCSLSLDSV